MAKRGRPKKKKGDPTAPVSSQIIGSISDNDRFFFKVTPTYKLHEVSAKLAKLSTTVQAKDTQIGKTYSTAVGTIVGVKEKHLGNDEFEKYILIEKVKYKSVQMGQKKRGRPKGSKNKRKKKENLDTWVEQNFKEKEK